MKLIKSLIAAAALLIPAASHATTTLVYDTDGFALADLPLVDGSMLDFFDDGVDATDISATGGLDGGAAFGSLLVSDASGVLLSSDTVLGFEPLVLPPEVTGAPTLDTLIVEFGGLTGSDVALFETGVAIAIFTFFLEEEDAGFVPFVTAEIYAELAPIPLPATLPLLAAALGAGFVLRRRSSA